MEAQTGHEPRKQNGSDSIQSIKQGGKEAIEKVSRSFQSDKGADPHQSEGTITKQIENLTTQVPSGTFLSAAVGAIGISLFMQLMGRKEDAQFVGQWVPTVLLLGLYNKLVKLHGSE